MYQDLALAAAQKYGIPPDLFLRQIQQESGWNPNAVSPAGAQGLGQLMPGTAADLGVSDPFDPAQNLDGAARYMRQMYDRFGDWGLSLQAFNAGPGNVEKYGGNVPFDETRNYLAAIMGDGYTQAPQSSPYSGGNALGGLSAPEYANALAALAEPPERRVPQFWQGHDVRDFLRS